MKNEYLITLPRSARPKGSEIRQKNGNTLNKNLRRPIPECSPIARLNTVRQATGKAGIESIRKAVAS